jgi:plastocyanin
MRFVTGFAAALPIALAAVACGGDDEAGVNGNDVQATPQLVEITMKDFSYVPPKLRGSVGAPIEVTLKNTGKTAHTFTIDEFNVDTEVAAGEETKVMVLPPEPGEFNYYCRFHKEQEMRGAITTVSEGAESGGEPTSADEGPTGEPEEDPYEY